jgi:hypothetical protein
LTVHSTIYSQIVDGGYLFNDIGLLPAHIDRNQIADHLGRLPIRPTDYGHQFRDLPALIDLVSTHDGVFNAMRHVISQHFFLDAPERGPHGRNLRDDINAVAVLLDHF